ncbi:THAP domain-containing protein 5-like [Dermacentor silvarum]|uniref:THAP domain-containing protein 5-like n=1 Tax=Dermacentor silvarum TaxID=543639 RepID=UPI002101C7B2|nr:THAP domain-containing protein 5-like [Dermacentor silvarum]
MFRFPTSPSRRKRWLAQVKRDCWEPTTASRVCYAHFEDSSFEQKRQDGLKKLRPDAVPTVFAFRAAPKHRKPPKKRSCPVQPSCDATPATSPEPHQPLDSDSTKMDDSAPVPTLVVEEESCHAGNENAHELTSAMAPCLFPQHPNGIPVPNSTNSVGQSRDVSATHQPFGGNAGSSSVTIGQENAELRKKTSDLTRKYINLQRVHDKTRLKLQSLRKKVSSLEKEVCALKSASFLNEDQVKSLTMETTKGHKWSEKTIRVALQIKHACGTTGYEMLRSLSYPIPSNRTLIRRLQNIRFLPGILHEVFNVLKHKVEAMEDIEKD